MAKSYLRIGTAARFGIISLYLCIHYLFHDAYLLMHRLMHHPKISHKYVQSYIIKEY